jgi:hypothetical protein
MEKVVSQKKEPSRQQETKLEEVIKPNTRSNSRTYCSLESFSEEKLILIKNKVKTKTKIFKTQ